MEEKTCLNCRFYKSDIDGFRYCRIMLGVSPTETDCKIYEPKPKEK